MLCVWQIIERGFHPEGVGKVTFSCPVVRKMPPVVLEDSGKIKRIRGISYLHYNLYLFVLQRHFVIGFYELMSECMYVCLSVCMYVCMYMYVCMSVCMYVYMCCVYVAMYTCMHAYMYVLDYTHTHMFIHWVYFLTRFTDTLHE